MYSSVDTLWVLLGAILVFFMQAGFCMVEAGFTRAKNAGNIIMKNFVDFSIGSLIFWFFGFSIMFGATNYGLFGTLDLFTTKNYDSTVPGYAFLLFQTVFCATSATIVSGALAERTKFSAYCMISFCLCALVYPISGHWIWGGGWLAQLGFHDFAGSTAVHLVGGVAAFIGAKMVGPRIGKYTKSGISKAIPGHSLTLGALGVFILWFAWFGFNGCSTLSASGDETLSLIGTILLNTNLAAATCAISTMFITWIKYKKSDLSMTLNGALGGLVAITAGCDLVSPFGAVLIGFLTSFVIVYGIEFIDKQLRIDDPVGAIGVHGLSGALGTLFVGLFAVNQGFVYTGNFSFFLIQFLGVVAIIIWVSTTMGTIFYLINKAVGLRVSDSEERIGLDLEEHGICSYADFMPVQDPLYPVNNTIPVEYSLPLISPQTDTTMTRVEIITKGTKLEELKTELNKIGITGMTVSNVLGYGNQKGKPEYYRGIELEINFHPKIKVEVIVCKVPVVDVIETAKKVLHTGHIGDGKIFVSPINTAVKIRTGEEGYAALQDEL